jgi:hypothetical protein
MNRAHIITVYKKMKELTSKNTETHFEKSKNMSGKSKNQSPLQDKGVKFEKEKKNADRSPPLKEIVCGEM